MEKDMLGELYAPMESDKNPCKRHSLLLKDRKFYTSSFGTDRNKREQCPINDWIDEGSSSVMWYEGVHYQAYVSKLDKAFAVIEIIQNYLQKMILIASGNPAGNPLFGDAIKNIMSP